jgi:hypothetical protein
MVGALVLARTAATPQLRDEILGAARNRLLEMPRSEPAARLCGADSRPRVALVGQLG